MKIRIRNKETRGAGSQPRIQGLAASLLDQMHHALHRDDWGLRQDYCVCHGPTDGEMCAFFVPWTENFSESQE